MIRAASKAAHGKILNVDDDPVKRYSVTRSLRSAGFEVVEAETGQECLRHPPEDLDLVILDVNLPDMSGFEVCRRLREDPARASLMVLHLSGTSVGEADRVRGLETGADAYLTEPVDARVLVATVKALLRLRDSEALARERLVNERAARAEAVGHAKRLETANRDLHRQQEELERLYGELRQVDRQKDEFLAMLAHELRNPLAPILNAVALLRTRPDAEVAERSLGIVERQTRHLGRMVEDLLDVSRITRGRIELRREPILLSKLLAEVLGAGSNVMDGRHPLTVREPPEPVWLEVDPTRLVQVLCNLLNNAVKYTPAGGMVALEAAKEEGWVVIRVRDAGCGIAPELLPRIFDLFVQESRSLDRSGGGLGIGLTLVKQLVELHGGSVEAASRGLNRGSEFTIRLPTIPAPYPAPDPAPARDPVRDPGRRGETARGARRRRVLVVEDNPDAAETLAQLLELWSYEVELAASGASALDAAASFRPDVILLDIGLPGMDGYEVARRLRAEGPADQAQLIAVTGYGREEDRQRAAAAGFDRHLTKPVDPEELRALLEQG